MSRIAEDRNKVSSFEKVGYIQLSASHKSLKITVDDNSKAFVETYYVSCADIQRVLAQPNFAAQIVKRIDRKVET